MTQKNVILYSKPNCMQCNFTKQFFMDNDIPFETKDVIESEAALAEVQELGFQSLPVIVAEGIEPFFGFRPDLLESLVGA
ncbi:glutaredoxin domain-containing protein [Granulicatella seriolae]|uniref:NrdH-redoxin n=1 Tax=Granulicatella seriolae TaxID=2967226 RepID=A0ABT1WN64_9LACT|nr:glutaredoxin domain-containing protein [Granulicatella seriolae]